MARPTEKIALNYLTPLRITISTAVVAFLTINMLGYWDIEDLFLSGTTIGARYGLGGLGNDETNQLIGSVLGVPVMDFGTIGGYRLPIEGGTFNSGPFWFLRWLLPVELILNLTHLAAMVVSAVAFANLWRLVRSLSDGISVLSNVMFFMCYVALYYPTFEYMLGQDWFAISIGYHAFITVISSLVAISFACRSANPSAKIIRTSLRLVLIGCYFLILLHVGLLPPVYAPSIAVVAFYAWRSFVRSIDKHGISLRFRDWKVECLLLLGVIVRGLALLAELVAEVTKRASIGSVYWWSTPTRSISDLKHFVGQLAGTELRPWISLIDASLLAEFNLNSLARLPHAATLVVTVLVIQLFRRPRSPHLGIIVLLLALWMVNFVLMIGVVHNPIRVPLDIQYRDALLVFALIAAALFSANLRPTAFGSARNVWKLALPVGVAITSLTIALSYPWSHYRQYGFSSPYALMNSLNDSDDWVQSLKAATTATDGVFVAIDEAFLNRWTDESVGDPRLRDWQGLRGFFELRRSGFITLEGTPKIRDASAFTGMTSNLKQVLEAPTSEFCNAGLFSFLRVSVIVMSSETEGDCLARLSRGSNDDITLSATRSTPLADSERSIVTLSNHQVFQVASHGSSVQQGVTCGILATASCFSSIGLTPASDWEPSSISCSLPCVMRISRTPDQQSDERLIVFPFNRDNALRLEDETGRRLPVTAVNGLLAVRTSEIVGQEVTVYFGSDWRMWLHVLAAYSQFAVLLPIAANMARRLRQRK